jgi:hypothetical protein
MGRVIKLLENVLGWIGKIEARLEAFDAKLELEQKELKETVRELKQQQRKAYPKLD